MNHKQATELANKAKYPMIATVVRMLPAHIDPPNDDGNLGAIAKSYGITAVPESFVVDRSGKIRHYFINKRNWAGDVAATCMQDLIDG